MDGKYWLAFALTSSNPIIFSALSDVFDDENESNAVAAGRTQAAIERYNAAGAVHGHDTRDDARRALVTDWMADRVRDPSASQMLLAYTRADVAELNRLARGTLRAAGRLGPDQAVETTNGERALRLGTG